jgi:peptide/nickel transport system ATP-binding protein
VTDDPLLAVDELSVAFQLGGQRPDAVRGVSFELRRGRVLALVGESGSGKSVTALATLGLLPRNAVVSGSIRLGGEQLVGAAARTLREVRGARIGTIFQEPTGALNPVFTVGDQIAEAVRAHHDLPRRAVGARVRELLGTVGIDDGDRIARAYPHQISGGQAQRAMIAMAISGGPELLIADEPTTALDVTVQAGILALLWQLRSTLDVAVLLITHDMGVVADLADDVVVLRQGQVVERAPAARLFATPGHEYTRALLAAVPRLPDTPGADPPPSTGDGAEVVRVSDAVIEYRGRHRDAPVRAVDGVSLDIAGGEVLGLVGESGSGKTTLGRALAGLVPLHSGAARVAGLDLARVTRRELRRLRSRIGIVFQDPAASLNPRWTVADSIAEPLVLHTDRPRPARDRRVAELLDAVDLPLALRDRYPHEMSGGQRQRVAIARALALAPALLVADEPTSALDVSVQARILDLLRQLRERFGFACLFVSHDLAVVAQLADRVAVMHRGRLVEQGATATVLGAPSHPYTQRLLAAAPVPDPAVQARRRDGLVRTRSAPG